MTVLGSCVRSPDAGPAPVLLDGNERLKSFGGSYASENGRWINYSFYPSSSAGSVGIEGQRRTITWSSEDVAGCGLSARPPFETVACGALVIVSWEAPIPASGEVELVDGRVVTAGGSTQGFFVQETERTSPRRLRLTFGFKRPSERSAVVMIQRIYLKRRSGPQIEKTFNPPIREKLRLVREPS